MEKESLYLSEENNKKIVPSKLEQLTESSRNEILNIIEIIPGIFGPAQKEDPLKDEVLPGTFFGDSDYWQLKKRNKRIRKEKIERSKEIQKMFENYENMKYFL